MFLLTKGMLVLELNQSLLSGSQTQYFTFCTEWTLKMGMMEVHMWGHIWDFIKQHPTTVSFVLSERSLEYRGKKGMNSR